MGRIQASVLAALIVAVAPLPSAGSPRLLVIDRIDTNHSTVGFSVPILAGLSEVEGKFTDFKVLIHFDEGDVTRSSVEATAMVGSIDTGIPERDKDLRSPAFFDAAKFPRLGFVSSSIERRGAESYVAHGSLTMHGVTRPIDIPFVLRTQKVDTKLQLSVRAELVLDRDAYGIAWRHPVKDFISNQISVRIRLLSKLIPLGETPVRASPP